MTTTIPTGTWSIDPTTTEIGFIAKNFIVKSVPGSFQLVAGTIEVAEPTVSSRVQFSIDASSFDTGHAKRDDHVRGDDFLGAGEHPTIDFTSNRIIKTENGYQVEGKLIVAGTVADVTFKTAVVNIVDDSIRFVATAELDRRELGVSKMPSLMISNTVIVDVAGTAVRS